MASKTGAVVAPFKEIETFKDYPVQDASSRRIGSAGVFFRAEGGPQFLEVILRGLLGKTSKLVPWELARVHDQEKRIVLSCGREDVEDAPDFDRDEPITLERARRTRAHYGLLEDMASLEPTAVREQPAAADTERSRQDGDQLPGRRLANDLQAQVQGLGGPSA